ncbi:MAG: AMP-binding protein, partial [Alphaproteobacteria bacterium]|nr:AMP-binding protein [Alphaproteobacteria bacterium]
MFGLMQDRPLLISQLIDFAAEYHGDTEIVSRSVEGPIHRYTYAQARRRAGQVAEALTALGIKPGDRIGTLAWNGYRHFELYYGISGMGAVCHTINPRLFPEQIAYIVNHAEDQLLFVDLNILPLVQSLAAQFKTVRHIVAMTDRAHLPADLEIPNLLVYEELIGGQPGTYAWPTFDERTASSLCY